MGNIKHLVCVRSKFSDKELMSKYLKIAKEIFAPAIRSQDTNNFELAMIVFEEDVLRIEDELELSFVPLYDNNQFLWYVKEGGYNIQTRHDIDDWMSPNYISTIQSTYRGVETDYDKVVIHAQPIKVDYHKEKETRMPKYTDKRTSMFLSLCQKHVTRSVWEKKHGNMGKIVDHVVLLPEGYVKWVIHGDNVTCRRPDNWQFSNTEER